MTQQQQIKLLDKIMPEIIETHDPEATMLKCARENNLSEAQLEKLGHVFNTAKTLVGLEKMANRGDSFSIVDVPAMVAKYNTYDAERELSYKQKKVHNQVNKLVKSSSGSEWDFLLKDEYKEPSSSHDLPSILDFAPEILEDPSIKLETTSSYDVPLNSLLKTASKCIAYSDTLEESIKQASYDINCDIEEECIKFARNLYNKEHLWPDLVMDAKDLFGKEKAENVLSLIEKAARATRYIHIAPSTEINRDYQKKVYFDSTGLMDKVANIKELCDLREEINQMVEAIEEGNREHEEEKQASLKSVIDYENLVNSIGIPEESLYKKKEKINKDYFNKERVLQNILLNDEVLSQADPNKVQALFSTIEKIAPSIAKNELLVAPVIKEALQYDAIPLPQIKALMDVENANMNIELNKAKISNLTGEYVI